MFNITIVAIGKLKEKYFQEAFGEYTKRLSPYCAVEVMELKPESFGSGDKDRAKAKEGEKIIKFLENNKRSKIFILDEHGRKFTSPQFAELLKPITEPMVFVIGGSLGFSDEVLNYPAEKIALSDMTFPHELARVNLIEQIYRAVTIIKGKEYHY